jgi:lactate racemase
MAELTMRVKAWYGDEVVSLPIPDTWNVRTSRLPDTRALDAEALAGAADTPVGSPTLVEVAAGARSAAIIVEDMTRPTPVAQIVPALLERLHAAGLDEDSIRFVLALGCHRQAPREELVKKLGADIVGRYEVLNHDLDGRFEYCGRSTRGTPIYINEAVMGADLKLIIGTTYPRGGTGFGGGAKCLVPGVAGQATIETYHKLPGGETLSTDSEMRQDIEEIARRVGIDFIVNAVLNGDREIVGLFCGDLVDAHRAAADYVTQVGLFPAVPEADVVISNTYPFDTNMRYTWRGTWPFSHHRDALKILVDYATEGAGYHQLFKGGGLPFAVRSEGEPSWRLFSPIIGPKEAYEVHPNCELFTRWEELVALVEREAGPAPTVAFYPHAGMGWIA